jgi:ABC-2 type transport system permease protein
MGNDWRKLKAVVAREFGERVRTKWFLISTLLGPVFFAAITIGPVLLAKRQGASSQTSNIVILDATGAGLGERIARALPDTARGGVAADSAVPPPTVRVVAPAEVAAAESLATQEVVRNTFRGVLVVDSSTLAGRRARYAGRNASSIADVERLREVVRREALAVRLAAEGLPAERVGALTGPRLRFATERIGDKGRGGSGAGTAIVAVIVAFLLYMMILLYGQNILRSVLEEKTTRVAEVVVASIRPDVLLAGKVIGVGAVGMLQQVVWFGGAALLGWYVMPFVTGGMRTGAAAQAAQAASDAAEATSALAIPAIGGGVILAAFGFFALGYLLYSAMFAAAGAMVNSDQEAQQAAFPVMLPLVLSAVFIQMVMSNPDSGASKFASWCPFTAPIIMPMRMSITSVSALEITAVLVGLAATVLAVTWIAARIYRVGLLAYGKRPGMGELLRWVRQAG